MGRLTATDLMPNFTGRTLDRRRYRVLDNLGSGAYGKVYRALDTSSPGREIFAIKCLNRPVRGSRADIMQQREFAHHKLVSGHPNIVTFHRCFFDGLYKYVVLDFCDGGDLFSAITEKRLFHRNGRLTKLAFAQLINAVEHCHTLGVFHRDIKPENVLCSNDGTNIRLADFGLSIMSPVSNDFGCGSSFYMSPECIGRHPHRRYFYLTSYNDIWALGVILTNMITGRNPWRYAIIEDACFSAYLNNNDFLKQVLPISEGVNSILKDIFNVNPKHRISLPKLRNRILSLDAFSVHDSRSTQGEIAIRQRFEVEPSGNTVGREPSVSSFAACSQSVIFDFDPERLCIQAPSQSQVDLVVETRQPDKVSAGSLTVPTSASSGSSGPESKGPITPATHAIDVEPPVDIPDISEEVQGYTVEPAVVRKLKASVAVPTITSKRRRAADILRSAVHHFKILSRIAHCHEES